MSYQIIDKNRYKFASRQQKFDLVQNSLLCFTALMSVSSPEIVTLLSNAALARERGQLSNEAHALEAALVLAPADPRILNTLGTNKLAVGAPTAALKYFEAAAAGDPNEPALWINVATASRRIGDNVREQNALENALDLDRLHFVAQLRLAELHQRLGNTRQAAQGWGAVVQLAAGIGNPPPLVVDAERRGQVFLRDHNAELGKVIDRALGEKLASLGPAARRFNACVNHSFGQRRIFHNECAGVHFPFLPADEFFDRSHFLWIEELEARTDKIRTEALAILAHGGEAIRPYVQMDAGTPDNKWSPLDGSLDWSACFLWEYGAPNQAVCDLCPETANALRLVSQNDIPGKAPSAFFSILKPGAHIPPHTGVTNTRTIVHLPLVVPENCQFRVGGETRQWREGEAFAFDDTIEHEAWNDSDLPRIILIFDVWNPYLTQDEQGLLTQFFTLTDPQ
jgi:aspartate beta-hydroxylase